LRGRVAELEQTRESPRMHELEEEVARLRREANRSAAERTALRFFEIDPKTGALFYYDPERVVVRDQADAQHLVDRDLRAANAAGLELVYVILLPRVSGPLYHPTDEDITRFEGWFQPREKDGLRVRWETMRGLGRGRKTG